MQRYWRTGFALIGISLGFGTVHAQEKLAAPRSETIIVEDSARPLSRWYVQADFITLHRSVGTSATLITDPSGTQALAHANGADFNWDAGPRVALGRQLASGNDIEFIYFGLYEFQTNATVAGPGKVVGSPIIGTSFKTEYHSTFNNFETNLRHWMNGEFSLLAGFRYINWHENLDGVFATGPVVAKPGPLASSSLLTNNNLFGLQAGGEWRRDFNGRCGIDAYGKAGIYGNEAYARGTLGVGPVSASVSDGACQTAFVGELGLVGTYRLTNRISLRGGYTVMWLEGLALAPNQLAGVNFANGSATAHTSAGVFLHGALFGLEVRW